RRRTSAGAVRVSNPSTSIRPASGARSVQMVRSVVVLPAPFGPSRPKISPLPASKDTPRSTWFLPSRFSSRSTTTAASATAYFFLVVEVFLAGAAFFAAAGLLVAAAFLVAAGLFAAEAFAAAGFFAGFASASGSAAFTGSGSGFACGGPIVLESVRWQLSQSMVVRTSPPILCSSRRRFRVRWQNGQ